MKAFTRFGLRDVDVESLVQKQSIVYENAATCWQDGHIIGNGDIGAVAYAPYWLEWTINKVDVYDGRNAPIKKHTYQEIIDESERRNTRLTHFMNEIEKPDPEYKGPLEPQLKSCGQVKIRTLTNEYSWAAPAPYTCRQELSLWEAEDRMSMSLVGGSLFEKIKNFNPEVTSFVSRLRNVMAISMRQVQGPLWAKKIELVRPPDADYPPPEFGQNADHSMIWFLQHCPDGSSYAMVLGVKVTGGVFEYHDPLEKKDCREPAGLVGVEQQGDRIWITVKGDVDIFISTASSRETAKPLDLAKQLVEQSFADGYETMNSEHRAWWEKFWKRSFVMFENNALREQMWYFGLYQLGSSLGRAPVPGLNGLWFGFSDSAVQKVFHAAYTMDVNIQLASMPVWSLNHPELGHPFMDTFLKSVPDVQKWTRAGFNLPGACFPLEMPFDSAIGEPTFGPSYRMSFTGGPFCGLLFCWAYRYTQDLDLLREKVYPFLREVVRFWAAFLKRTETGRYYVPWTVPCEESRLSRNAIDIVSLLKPCLEMAVEASKTLNVDAGDRKKWEAILRNYPEYPQFNGRIINGQDSDKEHASFWLSTLWPLIMAHDDSPELAALTKTTLDHWLGKGTGEVSGWPGFFIILTQLYLGENKNADDSVDSFIKSMLKPNGLMPHVPLSVKKAGPRYRELAASTPENDTALAMVLTQALLQSHNNLIRVFPGMVGKATARFGDLRAEGAFLVSSEMDHGRVTFVSIKAEVGGTARVLNPWKKKPVVVKRAAGKQKSVCGDVIEISMVKGETVTLFNGAKPSIKRIVANGQPSVKTMKFKDGTVVTLGKK